MKAQKHASGYVYVCVLRYTSEMLMPKSDLCDMYHRSTHVYMYKYAHTPVQWIAHGIYHVQPTHHTPVLLRDVSVRQSDPEP